MYIYRNTEGFAFISGFVRPFFFLSLLGMYYLDK